MPSRFAGAEPEAAPIVVPDRHRPRGAGASTRRGRFTRAPRRRLRIAVLAPPWIPVPAPAYGGIEEGRRWMLCAAASSATGHDVTLFAAADVDVASAPRASRCSTTRTLPDEIERCRWSRPTTWRRAFGMRSTPAADAGARSTSSTTTAGYAALAMADRLATAARPPCTARSNDDDPRLLRPHRRKAGSCASATHRAPPRRRRLPTSPAVHIPSPSTPGPLRAPRRSDHLLWLGRMVPVKGPHCAIAAARAAGVPLVLAGTAARPGGVLRREVEPHLDDDAVRYVGEVGAGQAGLYARARALLMPIRWPEPFGMVMVESLASGTPVIAFAHGSVPEISRTAPGFLIEDEDAMTPAIDKAAPDRSAALPQVGGALFAPRPHIPPAGLRGPFIARRFGVAVSVVSPAAWLRQPDDRPSTSPIRRSSRRATASAWPLARRPRLPLAVEHPLGLYLDDCRYLSRGP